MAFLSQLKEDHNEYRRSQQLSLFQWDSALETLAQTQLQHIQSTKQIQHGHVPTQGLQNIVSGKRNLLKPNVALKLWLGHQGHARPIQHPSFQKLGCSFHDDSNNNITILCNYSP